MEKAAYLFVNGFISILSQILILRELNISFFGIELIYILSMGIWLFWTAVGSFIGKKSYVPSKGLIRSSFLAFSVLLPLEILFIRGMRIILGGTAGTYMPFNHQVIALIFTLFPIGTILGILFQWTAKSYLEDDNKSLIKAYAIESSGSILGGMLSFAFFYFGIQNFISAVIVSNFSAVASVIKKDRRYSLIETLAITLSIIFFIFSVDIDQKSIKWTHPYLLTSCDSAYSRITIEKQYDQFTLFENDVLNIESESIYPEIFGNIAALSHTNPENVLIAGGFLDGLWKEIEKHKPKHLDLVELNLTLFNMIKNYIPKLSPSDSDIIKVHIDDPRQFIIKENNYDLILIGSKEPDSGLTNRFFTQEFFKLCAKRLKRDGILTLSLKSSENYQTSFIKLRNKSIYEALRTVFPNILFIPALNNIIVLASHSPLTENPDILTDRFKERKIKGRFVSAQFIRYIYTNDRRSEIKEALAKTVSTINTDKEPLCYKYTSFIWLSKFFPKFSSDLFFYNFKKPYSIYAYVLGLSFFTIFLIPFNIKLKKLLIIVLAAGTGMAVETILILFYQIKYGILFQNIGILLTLFMTGLTAGALGAELSEKHGTLLFQFFCTFYKKNSGKIMAIAQIFLSSYIFFIFYYDINISLTQISVILFLTGYLTSGIFAYVCKTFNNNQKHFISYIYAADLIGGCAASLIAGLFLIPFLGLLNSTLINIYFSFLILTLILMTAR